MCIYLIGRSVTIVRCCQRYEISSSGRQIKQCKNSCSRSILYNTRGYAGGLDGRRSQRRIANIKRVRSNAKS